VPIGPLGEFFPSVHKTRQPIDLELWPMVFDPASRYFTTIGNYKQSGNDVTYNGQIYRWSKHHEWEKFIDLPSRISQPFQLAMNVTDPADRTLLEKHGWGLQSAVEMSLDIFRAYRKLDDFLLLAEQILDVGIQFGDLSGASFHARLFPVRGFWHEGAAWLAEPTPWDCFCRWSIPATSPGRRLR
jgi:hypothetical protein